MKQMKWIDNGTMIYNSEENYVFRIGTVVKSYQYTPDITLNFLPYF